ncbi:ribonuclease H-like domain-containing protein [Tanacetum coccineum]
MHSFFANQSSGPQLDHEDLEQIDEFDLEEMDLKWQVAMISMRLKKFYKKTGRKLQFDAKEPVGFDKTKVECFNCHKTGHFARECRSKGNQDIRRRDAGNTGYKAKDNGRRPGKQEEPKALVTLDGDGVDWTGHAEDEQENFALMAYSHSGSDTEVTSCSKECEESYAKLKKLYDEQREQLGDASIEIKAYTLALAKVEAQLVCHQKNQLAYEEKIRFMKIDLDDKTDVLTYHKKLLAEAVKEKEELKTKLENFQSSSKGLSKLLNSQMSAKDKSGLGYGDQIHEGVLSYENEVFQSVFDSRSSDVEDSPVHNRFANIEGMHAVPPSMTGNYIPPGPDREVDDFMFTYGPKQSKTSESDTQTSNFDSYSDDEYVIQPSKELEKPSFAFVNTVKHVKTPREIVKEQNTYSPSPKADKRDWNGLISKRLGLGYGYSKKACFVCGCFSHLIRDCDFHKKRMAKQVKLNKKKVNTARQNSSSQAATTSTARKVNTARPICNTAEVMLVSAIWGKRETAVKPSAVRRWTLDDMIWGSLYSFMRATYGAELVSDASLINTARPKLSTDSTKIECMKLEAMVKERRIFKCWFHYHTTNGHQFTNVLTDIKMASPEQKKKGSGKLLKSING